MKNKIIEIQKAAEVLELARAAHESAITNLENIRRLRGQDGYAVTVGGIRVDVAVNAGREGGWAAKLIRGRDMIHLGALKALQGLVDEKAADVDRNEKRIKELVGELSYVSS